MTPGARRLQGTSRDRRRVTFTRTGDRLIVTFMPTRRILKQMQAIAIDRVLGRRNERADISSVASLRAAYQSELAVNYAEIEAEANALVARFRQINANILAHHLGCAACGGPIKAAKRISRRYCSDRCRQRAHRLATRDA
jgi:hypothetical protein